MQGKRRHLPLEIALTLLLTYYVFVGGVFFSVVDFWGHLVVQVVLLTLLLAWVILKAWRGTPFPRTPVDGLILLVLVAVGASTALSSDPRMSLEGFLRCIAYVLLFYLLTDMAVVRWRRRLLVRSLLLVTGVACIVGLFGHLDWYLGILSPVGARSVGLPVLDRRLSVGLSDPNSLAAYLGLMLPLILGEIVLNPSRQVRMALCIFAVAIVGTTWLTLSRGGMLGLAGGLSCFSVGFLLSAWGSERTTASLQRSRKWVALGLALVLVIVTSTVFISRGIGVGTVRSRLWTAALEMVLDRPVLGVGPFGFTRETLRYGDFGLADTLRRGQFGYWETAHNIGLHILAELGIVGFAVVAAIATRLFHLVYRAWSGLPSDTRIRAWAAASAIAGRAVHGLVDAPLLPTLNTVAFIIILAVLLAEVGVTRRPQAGESKLGKLVAVVLLVCYVVPSGLINYARWYQDKAAHAARAHHWESARDNLEKASAIDPLFSIHHLQLGLMYGQLSAIDPSLLDRAVDTFEAGAAMEPYFAAHHVNLGVLLWQREEYARAREELELAVQLQPGQYVPHLNLALFYEDQDETEGAVAECAAAVALRPQILRSLSSLENELATGHRTEIVESAKTLLRDAMPDDYLPKWASLDFAAGNMDQAKAEWEELLSGNPGDGGTMLSLGRVAAEQGDFESALAWFARAEQNLAPNRLSAVRLNRGAALLNMGDYGAARGELVGGIEAGGSSPVFHYYLGQLAELEADWELALEEHTMATVWEQELETYDTAVRLRPHYVGEFVPGVQVWNTVPERVGPYTGAARAYEMLGRVSEARDIYVNLWNAGTRLEPVREGLQRLAER